MYLSFAAYSSARSTARASNIDGGILRSGVVVTPNHRASKVSRSKMISGRAMTSPSKRAIGSPIASSSTPRRSSSSASLGTTYRIIFVTPTSVRSPRNVISISPSSVVQVAEW